MDVKKGGVIQPTILWNIAVACWNNSNPPVGLILIQWQNRVHFFQTYLSKPRMQIPQK